MHWKQNINFLLQGNTKYNQLNEYKKQCNSFDLRIFQHFIETKYSNKTIKRKEKPKKQLLTLKNPDLLYLQENWTPDTDPTKPLQENKLTKLN